MIAHFVGGFFVVFFGGGCPPFLFVFGRGWGQLFVYTEVILGSVTSSQQPAGDGDMIMFAV